MIAGQNPGYIVKALEAYKSGERNHPSMRAIARGLSAQDMADIAVYYGTAAK
jgi:cytochrome c553